MGTFNKTKAGESERDKAVNLLETESFKEAVKCYEEAITMRKGLVRSAAQAGENSHIYDVANARLGASYLLAATTEPSEEKIKNYAKEAYEIFRNLSEKHPDEDNFIKFRDWMRTLI